MKTLRDVTDEARLLTLLDQLEQGDAVRTIDEAHMTDLLRARVKGQDHVISDLVPIVRRAWARKQRSRPIASLAFCGPTGTGKTELAKAITEYLFRKEENMIRIDGQNHTEAHSINALIGNNAVYQGAKPGTLTQPMIGNDRRVILFDEIDKAHPTIWDLFLTMMGEGKLTDRNTNKEVSFVNSIVILTMNAEFEAVLKLQDQHEDVDELNNAVKQHLVTTKVVPRPELAGRIDRIAVFKVLPIEVQAAIAALKAQKLVADYGLELDYVDPMILFDALRRSQKLSDFGVRELDRILEETIADPCIEADAAGHDKVRLEFDEGAGRIDVVAAETAGDGAKS